MQGQRFQPVTQPQNARGSPDGEPERPPRRTTVVVGIAAAIVVFAAMVAFLGYRAFTRPEPSRVAVIVGNEGWLGSEVIVSGGSLAQPITAVIDSSNRYSIPFFLDPGEYLVRVRVGGVEVLREAFSLVDTGVRYVLLPRQVPEPRDEAPAAATREK